MGVTGGSVPLSLSLSLVLTQRQRYWNKERGKYADATLLSVG